MHPTYLKGKSVYQAQDGSLYAEDSGGGFSVSPKMHKVVEKLNELAADVPSGAAWTAPRAAELDAMSLADFIQPFGLDAMDTLSFDVGFRLTDTIHYQEVSLLYALSRINYAGSYEQLEGFTGGAQEQRIENGSQYISEVMARQIGDKLHLSSPVRKITGWDTDVVTVHSDGGVFRARQVIFAISPALCDKIAFQPALPQQRRELQQRWPGFTPGRKTCHVYERPFWRDQGYNGWFFSIGGEVMWAYDNSPEDRIHRRDQCVYFSLHAQRPRSLGSHAGRHVCRGVRGRGAELHRIPRSGLGPGRMVSRLCFTATTRIYYQWRNAVTARAYWSTGVVRYGNG